MPHSPHTHCPQALKKQSGSQTAGFIELHTQCLRPALSSFLWEGGLWLLPDLHIPRDQGTALILNEQ